MFLRFYGQTDECIDECLQEMRALGYEFTETRGPGKLSVNLFGPKPLQVDLVFASKEIEKVFFADDRAKEIYRKYATALRVPAKLVERGPEDKSYQVG